MDSSAGFGQNSPSAKKLKPTGAQPSAPPSAPNSMAKIFINIFMITANFAMLSHHIFDGKKSNSRYYIDDVHKTRMDFSFFFNVQRYFLLISSKRR